MCNKIICNLLKCEQVYWGREDAFEGNSDQGITAVQGRLRGKCVISHEKISVERSSVPDPLLSGTDPDPALQWLSRCQQK